MRSPKARSEAEIDKAIDDVFEIAEFLDGGLKAQAAFNLDALEEVIGRKLEDRAEIEAQQHQAGRWTFIGSGLVHERFKATLREHLAEGRRPPGGSRADLRLKPINPKEKVNVGHR